jgi:hypothetical protein
MKRTLLVVVAIFSLGGCAIVRVPMGSGAGTNRSGLSSAPQCAPSQYWDGAMCRHKGQGSGARKHDG